MLFPTLRQSRLLPPFTRASSNSRPAERGRCCRHRTATQELALTPGLFTPPGGTEFPRLMISLTWLMSSAAGAIRCRLPAESAADIGPPPKNLPLPRHVAHRPAEPNSLGKIFDFLKLVNEFCSGDKSLPAARRRCCRHRTTTQELALTPGPCTPAGGTGKFPRADIFGPLFKTV